MYSIFLFVIPDDLSCITSLNAEKIHSLAAEETGVAKILAATVKSVGSVFLRSYLKFITV